VPRPLAALLAAVLLVGVAWVLIVPPAEVPDEPLHVAHVQILAETGERPEPVGDEGQPVFSTEQRLARRLSNYEAPIHEPTVKTEWRPSAFARWRAEQATLDGKARRDGGGPNPTAANPPLYYVWESVAYLATSWGDLFTRWYAMRAWSLLLLAAAVVATWLLAAEVAGRDRLAQLAAASFVGLQPGALAISAGINPDAAMIAAWAVVMWLGVRLLRRGPSWRGAGALLAATAAALLVKATSFGLIPAVAVVLAMTAVQAARRQRLDPVRAVQLGVVAAALVGLVAVSGAADRLSRALIGGDASLRGFVSYLWQAYLPNLPFQTQVRNLPAFWGYDVWIRSGWGNFGWAELLLPAGVNIAIAVACGAILAAAAVALLRGWFPVDRLVLVFLGLVAATLVLGLHWAEYRQFIDIHLSLLQGRYLLPLLPIGGLAVAAALSNLRPAARPVALSVLLVGLLAVDVFSLGILVGRFYA
jgi:hypothetical protein